MDNWLNKSPNIPKQAASAKKIYKFNPQWLESPEFSTWSTKKKNDSAFCKVCNQKIIAHKIDIVRHSASTKHVRNSTVIAVVQPIDQALQKSVKSNVKRAELKLVGLLATNDLSFRFIDSFVPVLKSALNDSEIIKGLALHRSKATGIMKNILGVTFSKMLFFKLKNSYFSIIVDETTDVSDVKQCAFTVIFYDNLQLEVSTQCFDLKECPSGSAANIYSLLKESIKEKGVPFENLIAFAADTPNVMFGQFNSVSALLKKDKPLAVTIKCSCHIIHLVASKACLKLPQIEDLLRNIGSHFNRSFLRQEKFKEFQNYFQVDIHKILSPVVTRWLSIKACVDRVLEQFEALRAYLRLDVFEDPSKTTEFMLRTMDNPSTKVYLEFMSYSLGILTDFNTIFQTERPMLYKLKREVTRVIKIFLSNFIDIKVVKSHDVWTIDYKDPAYFVKTNQIYVGVLAQTSLQNLTENHKEIVLNKCIQFYIEAIDQIKKRFDFSDEIYDILDIVDPVFAQSFVLKTLSSFKKRFEFDDVNLQNLDNEWREHALLDHDNIYMQSSLDPENYWKKVFELKDSSGSSKFPNLKKIISLLLILPFSNASVERIFSNLKMCKTDLRNRLNTDTVAAILYTKQGIKQNGDTSFEPQEQMYQLNWRM